MAKTIAAAGRYPYGICGFVIQGAVLKDGSTLTEARIHKQRNSYDYDIRDTNGKIHRSVRITGFDKNGKHLDYGKDDEVLLGDIKNGHFYVRAMNIDDEYGFATKFFDNKVILSTGIHLYDLVPPTCGLPKQPLGQVYVDTVRIGDTIITGSVMALAGDLNPDTMLVSVTINGITYTSTVDDLRFSITIPTLQDSDSITITITSDYYQTAVLEVPVLGEDDDSDYVTSFALSSTSFVQQDNGSYSSTLLGAVHNRGTDFIIQMQNSSGTVFIPSVQYNSSTADITVNLQTVQDLNVIMIGNSLQHSVYSQSFTEDDWNLVNGVYTISIPQSTHNQTDNIVIQVAEEVSTNEYRLIQEQCIIDESDNVTLTVDNPFSGRVVISGK